MSLIGMKLLRNGVKYTSLLLLCTLLCGCSSTPTVTLVPCKLDKEGTTYYYDTNENYYWRKSGDTNIYPISDIGLKAEPALHIVETKADYALTEQEVSRYSGNLLDVSAYVRVLTENGYSVAVVEATPALLELRADSVDYSVRVIYMSGDYVRIYSVDKNGVGCVAPFL